VFLEAQTEAPGGGAIELRKARISVRSDGRDGGKVGIIRSPLRATVVPDCGGKNGCSNCPHARKAARPPGLSTPNISTRAIFMRVKNLIPHRQVSRSTQKLEMGKLAASA
jgi:hypothetical protein